MSHSGGASAFGLRHECTASWPRRWQIGVRAPGDGRGNALRTRPRVGIPKPQMDIQTSGQLRPLQE